MNSLNQYWQDSFGGSRCDLFEGLVSRYSEPHRYYHNIEHIRKCLSFLGEFSVTNIRVCSAFIWYHDAVYIPFSSSNEEDSARLAVHELNGLLTKSEIDLVEKYILSTKNHRSDPSDEDQSLLLDIDMSILGSNEAEYLEYRNQIFDEYFPDGYPDDFDKFKVGRSKFIRSVLLNPIYSTKVMGERFESQARKNLEMELLSYQ